MWLLACGSVDVASLQLEITGFYFQCYIKSIGDCGGGAPLLFKINWRRKGLPASNMFRPFWAERSAENVPNMVF